MIKNKEFLISIIIPVYNTEKYIAGCIDSCLNQSYKNIEIVIVNDCSPDNSEQIILDYQKRDSRIKYIKHTVNKGSMQTRKTAILEAQGEYILFLDSDDTISLNTCKQVAKVIKKNSPDIIQISVKIIENKSQDFYNLFFEPCFDDQVFRTLFVEKIYTSWIIGGKITRRDLLLRVFNEFPENMKIFVSEDFLIFFIAAYFAKSYIGLPECIYYYNKDNNTSTTTQKYIRDKDIEKICENWREFFQIFNHFKTKYNIDQKYPTIKNESAHTFAIIQQLLLKFPINKQKEILESLCQNENRENIFNILYEFPLGKTIPIFSKNKNKILRPVQTIAFPLLSMSGGGTEKVASMLTEYFLELGYKVIILLEQISTENNTENNFDFDGTIIEYISKEKRYTELNQIIQKYNIDTILFHNFWNFTTFTDIEYLTFRNDINTIFLLHNTPLWNIFSVGYDNWAFDVGYRMVDIMIVLSNKDKIYLENKAIPCVYMPNPLPKDPEMTPSSSLDKPRVLFIGRLDPVKNILEIIEMFYQVVQQVPQAHLDIIGTGELEIEVKNLIQNLGLNNNITMHGYQADPSVFYQNATVHILFSKFEGFPLVWSEAKAYGVPTVISNMDYLEMMNYGGAIVVEQNNINSFADAIISLLNNPDLRKKLGKEAKESLNYFKTSDAIKKWQELFTAISENKLSELEMLKPIISNETNEIIKNYEFKKMITYSEFHKDISWIKEDINYKYWQNRKNRNSLISNIIKKLFPKDSLIHKIIKKIAKKISKSLNYDS